MDSVESVVVWSSASTVTHAPTRCARSQMVWAFSNAIFSPSRGNACPSADSFSDTSSGRTVSRGLPTLVERVEQRQVGLDGGIRSVDVGDVLAEVVDR